MATLDEVTASFSKLLADIKTEIDALKAKIDQGGAVEAADLDKIKNAIDAADAAIPPAA